MPDLKTPNPQHLQYIQTCILIFGRCRNNGDPSLGMAPYFRYAPWDVLL